MINKNTQTLRLFGLCGIVSSSLVKMFAILFFHFKVELIKQSQSKPNVAIFFDNLVLKYLIT